MRKNAQQHGRVHVSIDYRSAPLALVEMSHLSAEARLLMVWLFMHGNGWEFLVGYALKTLGIAEWTWQRRVRKELVDNGFLIQSRLVGEPGSPGFAWINDFTDGPVRLYQQFVGIQNVSLQNVSLQNAGITNTSKPNKSSIGKQKKERDRPAEIQPAAAGSTLLDDESRKKEERDLAYARQAGTAGGLTAEEIEAAISSSQYPSKAPAAVEAAIKVKAAAVAEARYHALLQMHPGEAPTPKTKAKWPHPIKCR